MALIELFHGNPKTDKERILNVLDRGLAAAEGTAEAIWSGSDDLRRLFTCEGRDRPKFLGDCSPEHQAIYDEWLERNRNRVNAVLKTDGTPYKP
jgi:hypothetical protein